MKALTKQHMLLAFALMGAAALATGGATWWFLQAPHQVQGDAERPVPSNQHFKYVSLDKVVVMLRGQEDDATVHYMAVDLVFKAPAEQEKMTKEHLPLLRSIAVKALSAYSLDTARAMTIDQFAAGVNRAFSESYARDNQDKPFTEAMIGKLIIE